MTAERVELLKTFGVQLFVSLDSSDPEELAQIRRGARWEYIERNLKLLADHQPRPYFVFTLQAGNIHRIADMARLARTFNVGLIYNVVRSDVPDHRVLNRVISEWAAIRSAFVEAKALLDSAGLPCLIPDQIQGVELDLHTSAKSNGSRSSCPALHRETCIQHDGFVTPCNMFHPHKMGHIRDGDICKSSTLNRRKSSAGHTSRMLIAGIVPGWEVTLEFMVHLPSGDTLDYWWEEMRGRAGRKRFLLTKVLEVIAYKVSKTGRVKRRHPKARSILELQPKVLRNGVTSQSRAVVVMPAKCSTEFQADLLRRAVGKILDQAATVIVVNDGYTTLAPTSERGSSFE